MWYQNTCSDTDGTGQFDVKGCALDKGVVAGEEIHFMNVLSLDEPNKEDARWPLLGVKVAWHQRNCDPLWKNIGSQQ